MIAPITATGDVRDHPLERLVERRRPPSRRITSGPGDAELVPLAAHLLDEDRQVQLAAARDPVSFSPVSSSTWSATLVSSSRSRRSLMWRLVTNSPSVPAKGLVLGLKVTLTVGSSTGTTGSASGVSGISQGVADLDARRGPTRPTMSPAAMRSVSICLQPEVGVGPGDPGPRGARPSRPDPHHGVPLPRPAREADPPDGDAAKVVGVVEVRHLELEGGVHIGVGLRECGGRSRRTAARGRRPAHVPPARRGPRGRRRGGSRESRAALRWHRARPSGRR